MKRTLLFLASATVVAAMASCQKYDDSALVERIGNVEESVTSLEERIKANEDAVRKLENAEKNALTVEVKQIENGYELIFSDGQKATIYNGAKGDKGEQGEKGEAGEKGEPGESGISDFSIEETPEAYVFTYDGKTYTIAKTISSGFALSVETDWVAIIPGATVRLPYTITGGDNTTHVLAEASGYEVAVKDGFVEITAPEVLPAGGYVIIKAIRNSDASYKALYIAMEEGVLSYVADAQEIQNTGGEVNIGITSNLEYEVVIPEAAQSWIHLKPATKAVSTETVTLTVDPNEGLKRQTEIKIVPSIGELKTIVVLQYGADDKVFIDVDLATVASFNVSGTAVEQPVAMTQTIEDENVFAFYGDLKAGYFYLAMVGTEGAIVPLEGTSINPAVTSDFDQEYEALTFEKHWTVPADGKYRIVLNRETKKVTIYDEANDLQPLTKEFQHAGSTDWILARHMISGTYYLSTNSKWDNWKGKPYTFNASVADPQILTFVPDAAPLATDKQICIKTGNSINDDYTIVKEGTATGENDPTNSSANGMKFLSKTLDFAPAGGVDTPIAMNEWLNMEIAVSNKRWTSADQIVINKIIIDIRNNRIWFE